MNERSTTESAVRAEQVGFQYKERRALDAVSFEVAPGSMHALLGPNGSGKSTLFKILATILPFNEGKVSVLGMDLAKQLDDVRQRIGVVFQSPAIDKQLSVRQNLTYGGHLYGLRGAELEHRIDQVLEQTALQDRKKDLVSTLSGGLKRRVELAKALLSKPSLLLLDEPTTGLDPGVRRDLWRLLQQQGVTVLVTTHLMDEAELADQITILSHGKVVAEGTPRELKQSLSGQHVLEVRCAEPESLVPHLRDRTGQEPLLQDGILRVRAADAHELISDIVGQLGDGFDSISLSQPSLEDVFIDRTGHRFLDQEEDHTQPATTVEAGAQ